MNIIKNIFYGKKKTDIRKLHDELDEKLKPKVEEKKIDLQKAWDAIKQLFMTKEERAFHKIKQLNGTIKLEDENIHKLAHKIIEDHADEPELHLAYQIHMHDDLYKKKFHKNLMLRHQARFKAAMREGNMEQAKTAIDGLMVDFNKSKNAESNTVINTGRILLDYKNDVNFQVILNYVKSKIPDEQEQYDFLGMSSFHVDQLKKAVGERNTEKIKESIEWLIKSPEGRKELKRYKDETIVSDYIKNRILVDEDLLNKDFTTHFIEEKFLTAARELSDATVKKESDKEIERKILFFPSGTQEEKNFLVLQFFKQVVEDKNYEKISKYGKTLEETMMGKVFFERNEEMKKVYETTKMNLQGQFDLAMEDENLDKAKWVIDKLIEEFTKNPKQNQKIGEFLSKYIEDENFEEILDYVREKIPKDFDRMNFLSMGLFYVDRIQQDLKNNNMSNLTNFAKWIKSEKYGENFLIKMKKKYPNKELGLYF